LFSCQEKSNKIGSNNNRESYLNDTSLTSTSIKENEKISEPPLSYLLEYSGKYEFESKLFNNEPLNSRLKNILGDNYRVLSDCQTQIPIEIKNGIIIFKGWVTHLPDVSNYVIYIDINDDKIYAGVWDGGNDIAELYSENSQDYPKWLIDWKEETEKDYSIKNNESLKETETIKEYFKIGDEVQVGNFVYLVRKIVFIKTVENAFTEQTADGIYLIVYLAVLNKSREPRTLANSMFKVFDSDGYKYETSQNAITILVLDDQDKVFLFKEIPPKIPKEIIMPFEVPTSNDIYTLQVSGGFWTGETVKIQLINQ
jgi:hypothetical protein